MSFQVTDLPKLNSLTKYPSIPTYHVLDTATGRLKEQLSVEMDWHLTVTEKVDGTNSRLILAPDGDFIIGSREELLYAKDDRVGNPAMGIVDALLPFIGEFVPRRNTLSVFYLETYGGKVTANSKQYTGEKNIGVRLFDVAMIPDWEEKLNWSPAAFSGWRDSNSWRFKEEDWLGMNYGPTPPDPGLLVPRWSVERLPRGIEETYEWLKAQIQETQCALDRGAAGKPEGVVVRNADRSQIVKIRFEDYEKTLRKERR